MRKTWKSALSIVLGATLLLSVALFAGAADPSLKVLVASDIHYRPYSALPPLSEVNELPGDPIYYHVNTKGMLTYEADAVLDAFFKKAEKSGAKYLLIPGDMSEEGHWAEHLGIAQKLREFKERTGIKVFVIPGNHDIRTSASQGRLDLSDFLEVYADLGYDETLARFEGDASYTAELSGGYRLLAIDAIVYREDESYISPELFAWIEEQARTAKADGKKLVAMTHYNVLDHFLVEGFTAGLLTIDQYRTLATALADLGVKYVFTGHQHANDVSHAVTAQGSKIFDIETCSLITYPNAWREVTFSDASVKIETKYVDKIDTSLLPPGFSQAQIDLMEKDFQSYSQRFFRAAFQSYALMIPDLTETLADALGIAEGAPAYEAIEAMVAALADAVWLPLYGETGSVEAIARKAGTALAPSDYVNLLDLVGAMYAAHYAGNEDSSMDSLEVVLMGQAINAVLVTALMDMPLKAVNALLAAFGSPLVIPATGIPLTLAARRIYMRVPARVVTNELVRMLSAGIFDDWSTPDDLNAELEPYGESWDLEGHAVKITDLTFMLDIVLRVWKMALRIIVKVSPFASFV